MYKLFSILFLSMVLSATVTFAQDAKYVDKKSHKLSREAVQLDNSSSFYTDFKNRQIQVNRMNKSASLTLPMDLIVENYDWMWNSYAPSLAVIYDFTGDGIGDPFMIATGNRILSTAARGRYAVVGFADDLGVSTYFPYGINASGDPIRTGWNSHVVLDETNGKAYLAIYDFLASDGAIRDYLWEVDLLSDPSAATQLGDQNTVLQGGWARFALDGNGLFWQSVDNAEGIPLNLAVSTDGGVTFNEVDSLGSNDATFWGGDGNDPYPSANGNKISVITTCTKGGSLNGLGLAGATPDTSPDSASGLYHWYSMDGGNSWNGEWIHKEGDPTITNRPNYEPRFVNWDVAAYYVDPTEVTHYVRSGANSLGLVGVDTINVYPLVYWNDRDKHLMSLEIPAVETATYNNDLAPANFWGPNGPTVKTDKSGKVVVVFWDRPQFTGEPGTSPINTYSVTGGTDVYYSDVVYAYSLDGGVTFSEPIVATSVPNEANYWAVIAGVELNTAGDTATAHYVYYYDEFPGSAQVGANNPIGTNCTWKYNTVSFKVTPTAVEGNGTLVNNFNLEQNYPNPFNPNTKIKYSVAERSNVSIKVFDVLGKEIAALVNASKEAGSHEVTFDASNLASGLYIYTINAGNFTSSKKMMLMK